MKLPWATCSGPPYMHQQRVLVAEFSNSAFVVALFSEGGLPPESPTENLKMSGLNTLNTS